MFLQFAQTFYPLACFISVGVDIPPFQVLPDTFCRVPVDLVADFLLPNGAAQIGRLIVLLKTKKVAVR